MANVLVKKSDERENCSLNRNSGTGYQRVENEALFRGVILKILENSTSMPLRIYQLCFFRLFSGYYRRNW